MAAGRALQTLQPGAVTLAGLALLASAATDVFVYTTPYFPNNRLPGDTVYYVAASLAYHGAWLVYLARPAGCVPPTPRPNHENTKHTKTREEDVERRDRRARRALEAAARQRAGAAGPARAESGPQTQAIRMCFGLCLRPAFCSVARFAGVSRIHHQLDYRIQSASSA